MWLLLPRRNHQGSAAEMGRTLSGTMFREAMNQLRKNVKGTRAVVLIGTDGIVADHLRVAQSFDVEAFASEYATLLRIARRTSEDTGSGDLTEHIIVSARSITVARAFGPESYLVLVSDIQDQIGRARYELKRAARYIAGN
jgi:predicted regulator of Ras-like GTPase activity (Roadblock/LC7/MglB family)